MTTPNPMSLTEVITALRSVEAPQRPTPSVAQLRRLIDEVDQATAIHHMLERDELAEFDPADLLSFTEEFGKHRARVNKGSDAPKATPVAATATWSLLPIGTSEVEAARQAHRAGKKLKGNQKELLHTGLLDSEAPVAILPPGFDKNAGHGRDIGRSVAAVLAGKVSDSEIIRFAERHFAEKSIILDADHVVLLHWVVTNGLAEKLLELGGLKAVITPEGERELVPAGGSNHDLIRMLVEAYDLLDVARQDALEGLSALVRQDPGGAPDIPALRAAARKARWLAAGEIGRLEKLLAAVDADPGNASLHQILGSRLSSFAQWVKHNPSTFAITGVDRLNNAHLTQILATSGLLADESEEKAVIAELRTRLSEMGLVNDLDREIPEGLRAFKLGRLEEFYSSRQARCDGDPDWKLLYEAVPVLEELTVS